MGLLLEAVDVTGPLRWRWLLSDEETGNPIADHSVQLDPASDEVTRFRDLYDYVYSYAAPDQWAEDEARFVRAAGAWAGRDLLGESIGSAIVAEAPVTVRVKVPAALDSVLLWPLELAHADGKPLAAQGDVTLVYDVLPDAPTRRKSEVSEELRMLAVFSQPTKTSVLALRRERYALSQLIRRLAGRDRAMVRLQVVQYGVTRQRLREIADSSDGWDVLHLSGHGAGGVFWLEQRDGSPDPVQTDDLLALLRPVRRRVKLAVVSACESAADTTAQTLRLIGLTEQAEAVEGAESGERSATQIPGLARALVRELDCAVVAMRYPVADEFAIAFGDVLYEHLFSRRQPVDLAAARAVAQAADPAVSAAWPALSVATPGVFGIRAAGLTLPVPRGRPDMDPAAQPMAYFPSEPARFVGRAAAMAAASAALAPGSGQTAVLLHGMAGAGKTACALELAYRHADVFAAAAFWQAPTRDEEWPSALADLANRLEIQLGDYGFTMASQIGTVASLEAFLPRLRRVMEERGVLLVLDNLETLLTSDGGWRDPRWELLISALTRHDGESRVIMTSRIAPASVSPRVVTLPTHALSLEESVALARELPNLRGLLHADGGPVRAPVALMDADRERVRRVLRVVQGHPKLMELADAAADARDRLDAQLSMAEDAAAGEGLEAFFRDGMSKLDPDEFLGALSAWTVATLEGLSAEVRLMAEFVACLEDDDRVSYVIEGNWADTWRRLGRPGDAPAPEPLLEVLTRAALVEAELVPVAAASSTFGATGPDAGDESGSASPGGQPVVVAYRVHPGVAAAVLGAAGRDIREAADVELAAFWVTVSRRTRESAGGENSGLVVRAGLAAAPYLLRCGDWSTAGNLVEHAIRRDGAPGVVQAALPTLRQVAAATGTPEAKGRLARALRDVDPVEAEQLLRRAVDVAAKAGDYWNASVGAGDLVNLLRTAGRLREALEVAAQKADYTGRAGLGPWTQLMDQGMRLQVLVMLGEHAEVLAEVTDLRARMAGLSDLAEDNEAVIPWNVREGILSTGCASAVATEDWQQVLDLSAEITASMRRRDAGLHELASNMFNAAGPLIRLGRLGEASRLLAECQRVFEDYGDSASLAGVLSARAGLEDALGHRQAAADLQRTSLRLDYARPEPADIASGHFNLASLLVGLAEDSAAQRSHRLAAALIYRLVGMIHDLARTVSVLAIEMREDAVQTALPSTVAQVIATVELTQGFRLRALLAALEPSPAAVEDALSEVLRAAAELQSEDSAPDIATYLQQWEPVIANVVAACQAGQDLTAGVTETGNDLVDALDDLGENRGWTAVVGVLRRILAGERGESLLDGLDPVDTAIVAETLGRLAQPDAP